MDFRQRCLLATEFLESCFDENNDDDLTFDQRVELRKKDLPKEVRQVVDMTSDGL